MASSHSLHYQSFHQQSSHTIKLSEKKKKKKREIQMTILYNTYNYAIEIDSNCNEKNKSWLTEQMPIFRLILITSILQYIQPWLR